MKITPDMAKILDIGIALTTEKDYNKLLEKILKQSMEITECDAGTLYLEEENHLRFKIMRNRTLGIYQGGDGNEITLPPVEMTEENICTYAAIHHKIINIRDVYCNKQFDFKGPRNYDKITGYHTESMLVFPLVDHENRLHGVIQLINAMRDGKISEFGEEDEHVVYSLSCQAAITLANVRHLEAMKKMIHSMAAAFTTAIDERTPYNANHTKNVTKYVTEFMEYANKQNHLHKTDLFFNENEMEQITLAAKLHDIGKMTVPLAVMNKASRLGSKMQNVLNRMEKIALLMRIDYLEGNLDEEFLLSKLAELRKVKAFIREVNQIPYLDDENLEKVRKIGKMQYRSANGVCIPYLTMSEEECLSIRKGTLTNKERMVMQNHVVTTNKILSEMVFGEEYSQVVALASQHHEFIDGTGYPNKLKEDELPIGTRLLTIMDIFDSLISTDRPYKKPMTLDKALSVLDEMAAQGKLDSYLVSLWRRYLKEKVSNKATPMPSI